jgi:hypothetical protein
MEQSKKFIHDRLVLLLITVVAMLLVIGVSVVLLRFDVSKNPTTIVAYRPNISGASYQSGKPIDIYSLAIFMLLISAGGVVLGARTYAARRSISIFMLSSTIFLLILATRVAWSIISLQ